MPLTNGMHGTTAAVNSAITTPSTFLGFDMMNPLLAMVNLWFGTVMQVLDPVEAVCLSESGNAMSVPELNTSVLNIAAFVFVVGGLLILVLFGGAQWIISKLKSGHGGGEGKGAAVAGVGAIFIGIFALAIPTLSGQFWTGAEQCFALIQPMIGTETLVG